MRPSGHLERGLLRSRHSHPREGHGAKVASAPTPVNPSTRIRGTPIPVSLPRQTCQRLMEEGAEADVQTFVEGSSRVIERLGAETT